MGSVPLEQFWPTDRLMVPVGATVFIWMFLRPPVRIFFCRSSGSSPMKVAAPSFSASKAGKGPFSAARSAEAP